MNMLRETLNLTLSGFKTFISEYKYIALVVCSVVYAFANWKRFRKTKSSLLVVYSCCMGLAIIFPLTGMILQIYQTRFYDYSWIWSCVPLTAMLAWGIVTILFDEIHQNTENAEDKSEKQKLVLRRGMGLLTAVAVLYMCGNRGLLQGVDEQTLKDEQAAAEILMYLDEADLIADHVIWGKAGLMQYLRSHNGQVILFYGRDMWEAKAGAYDYEGYSEEEVACYEWMEIMSSEHNMYLLEIEQETEEVREAVSTGEKIVMAYAQGVDIVILPAEMASRVEVYLQEAAESYDKEVFGEVVGNYMIWQLK